MAAVVELDRVTVTYGRRAALRNVSVSFPEGAVGLLGPNGAGKSTMLKALLGFVPPQTGRMEVLGLEGGDMRRLWLHQANTNMNRLIAQRVLGHEASEDESPTVLDTYGNTSSAGSIIAFHRNHEDMVAGDTGLICSFGAGYSAGTVFVRKT